MVGCHGSSGFRTGLVGYHRSSGFSCYGSSGFRTGLVGYCGSSGFITGLVGCHGSSGFRTGLVGCHDYDLLDGLCEAVDGAVAVQYYCPIYGSDEEHEALSPCKMAQRLH